jgi:hypothetical protein
MRVACLVIAYSGAAVLAHTLPVYRRAGWDVFVHLDAKADIDVYRTAMAEAADQCRFIPNRTKVFWGGYSMMQAEFDLIHTARAASQYDRYVLISDDALPTRAPRELRSMIHADVDRITVQCAPEHTTFWDRYHGFYYFDHDATQPRGRPLTEIDEALVRKIRQLEWLRWRGKAPITVYFGSQFWCLTAETMDEILTICEQRPTLCPSFEFAALPDELMFQSICGNYLSEGRVFAGSIMWADFSKGHGPLVYSCKDDLPTDLAEQYAFARKADPQATQFLADHCAELLGAPDDEPSAVGDATPPSLPHIAAPSPQR